MLLYQRRIGAVINAFAMQGTLLALAAGWQAYSQGAPGRYVTAVLAFAAKGLLMPFALHAIVRRLDLHRTVETALGIGQSLVAGVAQPLTLVELDTVSGAARTTLPLPSTGNTVGANLACTLSVGMFANASWDWRLEQQFYADHCANTLNATFFGAPPPSQGGPACDAEGTVPASPRYAADWNADPIGLGHGDGVYPLWYWDREASLSVSYDGRFVSFPCYARNQSLPLQLGSWFAAAGGDAGNPLCSSTDLLDPFCYDDKVVAVVDAAGRVDTVTHLPGTDFFYGALVPDEPQYVRSAVTVGEFAPDVAFFVGGAADNGEGVMWLPDDATSPTKSGNRITNTPGYFDFGSLSLASPTGTPPAVFSAGDSPLAFVTSPSMLNAGAENAQHAALRGLSVMTVGGVPALSKDEAATFLPLHGFDAYVEVRQHARCSATLLALRPSQACGTRPLPG
jgi:hypothetical protein